MERKFKYGDYTFITNVSYCTVFTSNIRVSNNRDDNMNFETSRHNVNLGNLEEAIIICEKEAREWVDLNPLKDINSVEILLSKMGFEKVLTYELKKIYG